MRKKSFGQQKKNTLDSLIEMIRLRMITPHIKNNSVVLDIGCGYHAKLLKKLSPLIQKGIGIDISIKDEHPLRNITLKKGNVENKLPFKDSQFDTITALALIEHLDHPIKTLKESYRVLRPKGSLLLTTPSKKSQLLLEILSKFNLISKSEIMDHKRYYDSETLIKDLKQAGFRRENILVKYFEFGFNIFTKTTK